MKSLNFFTCFALASVIMISCTEKYDGQDIQQIYFEYYYVNNAWGFSYNHWIIDSDGNVRSIKNPDSVIQIDLADLNSYLANFDTVLFKIDESVLYEYVDMIKDAAKGEIDSETRNWADYGKTVYNCFTYEDERYKTVLLSEDSDAFEKHNLETSAQELDNWLKGLNEDVITKSYLLDTDQNILRFDSTLYYEADRGESLIKNAWLLNDTLKISVEYPGGCGNPVFKLYTDGYFMESGTLQLGLRLDFVADGACTDPVENELAFDISSVAEIYNYYYHVSSAEVNLKLEGFEELILYSF